MAKNMMVADDGVTNVIEQPQQTRGIVQPTVSAGYKPVGTNIDAQVVNQPDIDALNKAKADYGAATNDAQRNAAHEAAQAIRAKYNYSGGGDGSEFIQLKPGETKPGNQMDTGVNVSKQSTKIDDYMNLLQAKMTDTNNLNYQQQLDIIKQQLEAELNAAGVDTAKIESDYLMQLKSIETDTYNQLQEQKVNMAQRGIGNSQQGIGLEQGVYDRAAQTKYKSYVDRNDRINQITSRIATLRSKATTDIISAGIEKNKANNDVTIALAGKQIDRMIGLEDKEVTQNNNLALQNNDFKNQQVLEQLRNKYAQGLQNDQQAFEKDIVKQKFDNELKMFNLSAAQQIKLQGLDEQSKIKLMGMENSNRKELMKMDNANKIAIFNLEKESREKFFNAEANLQFEIMNAKKELTKEEMQMEFELDALKSIPGFVEAKYGNEGIAKNIQSATKYYGDKMSQLKTPLIGATMYMVTKDPVMEKLLIDITGKDSFELRNMKPEEFASMMNNYNNKDIQETIKSNIDRLFKYEPQTKSNYDFFKK